MWGQQKKRPGIAPRPLKEFKIPIFFTELFLEIFREFQGETAKNFNLI